MSSEKDKIKTGIDDAAEKAKEVSGKAVDKTKAAAKAVGKTVEDAGKKLKGAGS